MQDLEIPTPRHARDDLVGVAPRPALVGERLERRLEGREVGPVALQVGVARHRLDGCGAGFEQRAAQRLSKHRVDPAGSRQVHEGRAAVVARYPEVPQPVQEVRVVAVAKEGLRVGTEDCRVEVAKEGDLVRTTDAGHHRADRRVGEGGHEVRRALLGSGADVSRRGVLDRLDAVLTA